MPSELMDERSVEQINRQLKATIGKLQNEDRIDGNHYSLKVPLQYKGLRKSDLLFIGLNPLTPGKKELGNRVKAIVENLPKTFYRDETTWNSVLSAFREIERNLCGLSKKYKLRLSWHKLADYLSKHYTGKNQWLKDEIIKLENWVAKQGLGNQGFYKPYFGPIHEVTANISREFSWEHIDLIPLRTASEAKLWALFNGVDHPQEVAKRLLGVYKPFLTQSNLKAIVVCNTCSWQLMKPYTTYNGNPDLGCYWYHNTPVFPIGTLGPEHTNNPGQERLAWHIRYVLEDLS